MLLQGESMPAAHVLETGANRCAHATGQSVRAETGPSPPYARRSRRRARCRMHRPRRRGCTPVASIAARVRSPPMTAEPAPGRSSVGTGSGRFLARRSHGATSCTASRSIPFLLTLPAFTEARPEHRRFGRRSPPVADVAVRRNVVPGARAPPDTLEGDAGGLCRPRARYSARGAPRRCMRGKVRADARCHASCAAPDAAALPPARAGRRMAKAATRPRLAASARPGSAVWPQNPSFTSRPRRYGRRHFFSSRTCRRFPPGSSSAACSPPMEMPRPSRHSSRSRSPDARRHATVSGHFRRRGDTRPRRPLRGARRRRRNHSGEGDSNRLHHGRAPRARSGHRLRRLRGDGTLDLSAPFRAI